VVIAVLSGATLVVLPADVVPSGCVLAQAMITADSAKRKVGSPLPL
jgi:hypothetical protein